MNNDIYNLTNNILIRLNTTYLKFKSDNNTLYGIVSKNISKRYNISEILCHIKNIPKFGMFFYLNQSSYNIPVLQDTSHELIKIFYNKNIDSIVGVFKILDTYNGNILKKELYDNKKAFACICGYSNGKGSIKKINCINLIINRLK